MNNSKKYRIKEIEPSRYIVERKHFLYGWYNCRSWSKSGNECIFTTLPFARDQLEIAIGAHDFKPKVIN